MERFGHHHGVRQDRHEVRVAQPARDDVYMQVPQNAGARDLAEVEADVEPVRLHHARERILTAPRELHQVSEFLVGQPVQVRSLPVRHNQEMPSVVGISIEDSKARAIARNDVIGLVIVGLSDPGEEALWALRLGCQDVFNPPRGVQLFQAPTLVRQAGNVKILRRGPSPRPVTKWVIRAPI